MSSSAVDVQSSSDNSGGGAVVRGSKGIYTMAAVVAGLVAGAIGYAFVGESLAVLGIPDPGAATSVGFPLFRAMAWILASLSIGSFLFSSFFISPQPAPAPGEDGRIRLGRAVLSVDGHLAARTGSVAALCFGVVSLFMVPLVLSDISGQPLAQALTPASLSLAIDQVTTSQVWLLCAVLGLAVGIIGLGQRRWGSQPTMLLGAVVMIVPLGLDGHSAAGGSHDIGTNAYLWHLVFMAVWIGGLLALIAHGRRLGPGMQVAVRRYSVVALFSIVAVIVSGVISMLIRVQIGDVLTSRYGWVLVGKMVGALVLAGFGYAHRAITIPQLRTRPGAFVRLAVVEVVVMAAVAGLAVTMGRTPPPPPVFTGLNVMDIEIGYQLHKAPTFWGVFTVWRFDIMFGSIALLLAGLYLAGVRSVRRQGKAWRSSYTWWWLAGCASLLVTTSSGIGLYMPASYSMHMVGHMVLSMVVPLIFTLGAPLTLVTTVWDPGTGNQTTPHDWVVAFRNSAFLRIVTTPWVNLLQFLVFFYAIYLSFDFYGLVISDHSGHLIMNWVFLVSGYFYFWELVGPDEIPDRRPAAMRLAWLLVSMPVHLYFGVYLMQLQTVMGEDFYRSLQLPWEPDLLRDQKVGGGIAWAFGSFPLSFVIIHLAIEWLRDDSREGKRWDARADAAAASGEEDELAAYNAMLARYNQGESSTLHEYYGQPTPTDRTP